MTGLNAKTSQEIFRKDNPIILAQNRHLATFVPVRLAYNASGYLPGRVLGRNSVSGNYQNYDNGGASGEDVAVGVLFDSVPVEDFSSATGTQMARMIAGGELFESKMLGLDSGARTDLKSRSIIGQDGVTIFKF